MSYKNVTEPLFKIKSFKSLKEVMEPFFNVKNVKSFKKGMESFYGIKNFKTVMVSFKGLRTLKLVSTIFIKFLFFHQMIVLQNLRKMLFISSKKLLSFSRYSIFCISVLNSFSTCWPLL